MGGVVWSRALSNIRHDMALLGLTVGEATSSYETSNAHEFMFFVQSKTSRTRTLIHCPIMIRVLVLMINEALMVHVRQSRLGPCTPAQAPRYHVIWSKSTKALGWLLLLLVCLSLPLSLAPIVDIGHPSLHRLPFADQ